MLNPWYKKMEGKGGKGFSTFSNIIKRKEMGIKDGKVEEE